MAAYPFSRFQQDWSRTSPDNEYGVIQSHKIAAARVYGNVLLVAVLINGRKSGALNLTYDPKTHTLNFSPPGESALSGAVGAWCSKKLSAWAPFSWRRMEPICFYAAGECRPVPPASFSRLAASSTFRDFRLGSICLSRPQSTLPGPTSMKSSAPAAFSVACNRPSGLCR